MLMIGCFSTLFLWGDLNSSSDLVGQTTFAEQGRSRHVYSKYILIHEANLGVKKIFYSGRPLGDTACAPRILSSFSPTIPRSSHYDPQHPNLEGLDFGRMEDLVGILSGKVLWPDISGPDNDILDQIAPIVDDAIDKSATASIFGASSGTGIHNVHMNQSSLPRYDNGVYSDGAVLFKFNDGHWEAMFLAFASQKLPTDKEGMPMRESKSLAEILQ
ncbi:hypothetical protein BBP40_003388 [Aspergillus hancockii]|nr:hypothetical protein BBP40_003388 [Aspergillus hancockii]